MTESNLKANFGKKIKALRESCNLTQEQFAEQIELERDTISKIENGKRFPSCNTIEKIAKVFNLNYSTLFDFENFDNSANYDNAINIAAQNLNDKDKQFILNFIQLYQKSKY